MALNKKKALALFKQRGQLVDKLTDRLSGQVRESEAELFASVLEEFVDKLDVKDGVITNSLRNKRILSNIDRVFSDYAATKGVAIATGVAKGVQQLFDFNMQYFSAFESETKMIPIGNDIKVTLEGWLGIGDDGKVQKNGYLSQLVNDATLSNKVKSLMVKSIVSGTGLSETKSALKDLIMGEKGKLSALEKHYRNFVYDTFSQVDRTIGKVTADKLQLNYAIYEGGLIETSRQFCREHNGKVYTREEIAKFDPPTAKQPDYNPFTDLGGYGCRHHLNWIPYTLAVILRPDLANAA